MKTIIEITANDIKALSQMVLDFETDYIANHSVDADKRRAKYERLLKSLLDRVELADTRDVDRLPHIKAT